jgi:hypothetical protein
MTGTPGGGLAVWIFRALVVPPEISLLLGADTRRDGLLFFRRVSLLRVRLAILLYTLHNIFRDPINILRLVRDGETSFTQKE